MEAHKATIPDIFNNSTLIEVPFFQRQYVWNDELWSRFIEDMEFVVQTDRPHFLGAIILKAGRKKQPGEKFSKCYTVVDGQQRLTTFVLFMKVLALKKHEPTSFDMQFRIMGKDIALLHGKYDSEAFNKAVSATSLASIDNPEPKSRIIEAYNYFIENIDASKLDIMTIIANAQFVRINLDEDEDEQQIFDAINSLGVRLTTAELLKNYFYSREDISEYNANWAIVFEKDPETRTYWNQELEVGRLTRSLIDIFFDAYFQIFVQNPAFKVSTEDKIVYGRLDRLALSYQDFIKKYCDGNKKLIIDSMAEYAGKFRSIFDPDILNRQINKESFLQRINVVIFGLKNTTIIPFILYASMNASEEEFNKILLVLESYIMRRIVVRATTKNYNNLFQSFILNGIISSEALLEALKRSGDGTTYVPSDDNLLEGFNTSRLTNLQAKGIIYFIEANLRSSKNALAMLGFSQYSLEHLMPKKWRNHWEPCETSELARTRDYKLATLGNFAIITQSLNTSISDSSWAIKKAGNKRNPGLDHCASGLVTMENVLSEEVWNETKIETRAVWLYEKAKDIWSSVLPAVVEDGTYIDKSGYSAETKKRFWQYALPIIKIANNMTGAYLNCNPVKGNEVWGTFGIGGFKVGCVANLKQAYVWFYLGKKEKEKNKETYDQLYMHQDEINKAVGTELKWARADDFIASWITKELSGVSIGNEHDWPQMAEFLAKWSSKICAAVLPYLLPDISREAVFQKVSAWTREWASGKDSINFDISNCGRNHARFTTSGMSTILPDIKDAPSAWGTETHYFYEIYTMSSGKVCVQLAINSKNITEEFRATCDEIQKFYPTQSNKTEWDYRIPFKTASISFEGLTKEKLFAYLDDCLTRIQDFENELVIKLKD